MALKTANLDELSSIRTTSNTPGLLHTYYMVALHAGLFYNRIVHKYVNNFFLFLLLTFPLCLYCFMCTGGDRLMLGSFYQPNRWNHDLTISAPYVQSMLRRCKELCPRLNILKHSDIQVTVGIRPARKHKFRLEQDPYEPCIFHNYGHHRWGMTLCWGSARDLVNLIDKTVTTIACSEAQHLAKL